MTNKMLCNMFNIHALRELFIFLIIGCLAGCDNPRKEEKIAKTCPSEIATFIKPTLKEQNMWENRASMKPLELFTVSGLHFAIPTQYVGVGSIDTDECGRAKHFWINLFWTGSGFEPSRYNKNNDDLDKNFQQGSVTMSWYSVAPNTSPLPSSFYKNTAEAYPGFFDPGEQIIKDVLLAYSSKNVPDTTNFSHFQLINIHDPAGGLIHLHCSVNKQQFMSDQLGKKPAYEKCHTRWYYTTNDYVNISYHQKFIKDAYTFFSILNPFIQSFEIKG